MASQTLLGSSFEDWEDVYAYVSVYGVHIFVGAVLSAVTLYRREMSCNRVFHEEEEKEEAQEEESMPVSFISDEWEAETEELLEGAGLYCSGQPFRTLASLWLDCFPVIDQELPYVASKWLQKDDITPTELLERAGNFGEPILAAIALCLIKRAKEELPKSKRQQTPQYDPFTNKLPPDAHVHIASFLHPKDVVTLSCVSKSYRDVVNQSDTALAIWKTLWQRDYAWVVNEWSVGIEALRRSKTTTIIDKHFYFMFGQSYLNYVLAGQNTMQRCLVGLHFNIYDITPFLDTHPGSPETLMVYAGKDSTRFFEDMGHSSRARKLAQKLCVVSDVTNADGGWGLRPTQFTILQGESSSTPRVWNAGENLFLGRKQKRRQGTLESVRTRLEREEEQVKRRVLKAYASDASVLGQVNPYYDPFRQEWRVWYTSTDLTTVFAAVEGS